MYTFRIHFMGSEIYRSDMVYDTETEAETAGNERAKIIYEARKSEAITWDDESFDDFVVDVREIDTVPVDITEL